MYVIHEAVADGDSPVGTTALIHEQHTDGERVEFNPETGKARVPADVGESLVENYEDIHPAEESDE